uniref:Uncharacterized protein n=1 Tax=Steinernema glaseri TaxID=37863 RepID=A0A1I7Y5B4_9BILA
MKRLSPIEDESRCSDDRAIPEVHRGHSSAPHTSRRSCNLIGIFARDSSTEAPSKEAVEDWTSRWGGTSKHPSFYALSSVVVRSR